MLIQGFDERLCVLCRGRGFCRLSYCPLLASRTALVKLRRVESSKEIFGSSPPSVFVGRYGYPVINIGPSIPPEVGDTSIYDFPEKWLELRLENVIDYRWSLITGTVRVKVTDLNNSFIHRVHEVTLSAKPIDVEAYLEKPPRPRITLSEYEPPQGPRAPLRDLRVVGNPSVPRVVDRVYNDKYLKASDAVMILYNSNIPVTFIERVFSVGALGLWSNRRIVPTRWSITAVDSTISEHLLKEVKHYPEISSIEVYVRRHYDNLFAALLIPSKWSFEWMEAWWPGSTWNPGLEKVVVEGDYEGFCGRDSYPNIGGCYYASRLAVVEHLYGRRKQATAVLLREIYPGFNIPIGVWFVRENVRAMFREGPALRTSDLSEALKFISEETRLGSRKWLNSSRILKRVAYIKPITYYTNISFREGERRSD
ncbi:MAG: Nre family DNA repair protein [Sulfolobales archaeon]|nr:Nre family DNA repair protein [Sulfolobales archaeon]MCX8199059.1 Nre family DNA repair protein [Sulfolobales archaeon]MDW8170038.1 Nre family DNA repair protein [Desulfurococcaceae archaeon]